jgi:hypothetical protein
LYREEGAIDENKSRSPFARCCFGDETSEWGIAANQSAGGESQKDIGSGRFLKAIEESDGVWAFIRKAV